jgi:hypothetical protein
MLMMSGIAFFKGEAEASCGSANCFLVTGTQEGVFQPGQVVVDLSYRYIPQDRMMKGSSSTDDVLVPKVDFAGGGLELDHHRELRTINMLSQLDLSYGLSSVVTGALSVPFSNRRLHEHDDEVGTVDEHFTNTDGTSGFGDMALTGKGALLVTTKHLLVGGVGIKFPTGEYKLRDSEGAINEPTIMPGTGSFDLLLSGYYSYGWHPHEMDTFLSFLYRLNTENPLDYKFGNATMVNGGINYIPAEKVTLTGQVNARFAGRDEFKGESVPSTGGTFVYLTPGVRVQASPNTAFYTHLQMPVYQKVNEVNLAPRYGLLLGVSYAF